jgi:hypothetical protein
MKYKNISSVLTKTPYGILMNLAITIVESNVDWSLALRQQETGLSHKYTQSVM